MNTYVVRPVDDVFEDYSTSHLVVNAKSSDEAKAFHPFGPVIDPSDETEMEVRNNEWPSPDKLVATPIQAMGEGIVAVEDR